MALTFYKGPSMLGTSEILIILVVILILFGGKKLPEFAKSLGAGIREFKKACNGDDESTRCQQADQNLIDSSRENDRS